jgi:hypothetical protein
MQWEPRCPAYEVSTLETMKYHHLFPNKIITPPPFLQPLRALALVGRETNAKIPGRTLSYPVQDLNK